MRVEAKGIGAVVVIAIVVVIAAAAAVGGYFLLKGGGVKRVEFKTYTNENYSFKFNYPADWAFSKYVGGTIEYFNADENPTETGTGGITLSVQDKTIAENQFGISLDNLTSYISFIENSFENDKFEFEHDFLISKPTEIVIDNYHGVRYSFFSTPIFAFRSQELDVVKDNYLLQLSMTAPSNNYPTYEPIFQHVIDSFSFLSLTLITSVSSVR